MLESGSLDWSRCKFQPLVHQRIGVHSLLENKRFAILDEQGACKTKQIIDAACFLYEQGKIDTVLVMCPAQVKDVWIHPKYSQIVEHSFVKGVIREFYTGIEELPDKSRGLTWVITSLELLRRDKPRMMLKALLKPRKFWAVVDESSAIANWKAEQTKGAEYVAKGAARRTILNGTPYGNSIIGIYSQFHWLDPTILGFKNFYAFRNHHTTLGGFMGKQIMSYQNVEELQEKIKPFQLRRLKRDCIDLPPKMNAPLREVRLSKKTWEIYCSMRKDFVAYLNDLDKVSIVSSAPVKALRLAQICSGFLGGIDDGTTGETAMAAEIGSELTDHFLDYLDFRINANPMYRLVVWCRFRPEIARLRERIVTRFPDVTVRVLQGGLSKADRSDAVTLFHPDAPDPKGPAVLIGQPQAGRFGLNFTKCSNVDRLSNDYSQMTRAQAEDRVDRPGQKNPILVQDYVVTGPNGERTVSGMILKSLRTNENMAKWVCSRWVDEVMQEANDIPVISNERSENELPFE